MTRRVLLTGFEPFGQWERNPSAELATALDGWLPTSGWAVTGRCLPVSLRSLHAVLAGLHDELQPDVVLHAGLASALPHVAVERIGINMADFTIPDNDGFTAVDHSLVDTGPAAYFSTLPVRRIVENLHEAGIPAAISNSAGTYLCNAALYLSLHWAAVGHPMRRIGFVHLPLLPEQAARHGSLPGMSLAVAREALHVAVHTSIREME